jgi:hypothetical protein
VITFVLIVVTVFQEWPGSVVALVYVPTTTLGYAGCLVPKRKATEINGPCVYSSLMLIYEEHVNIDNVVTRIL